MDKVVICDWGGVVESYENNLKDLNDAKIRLIKIFTKALSDNEILDRWPARTSKGILLSVTNDEQDIKDWINLIEKNMNIKVQFDEFKKSYEEEMAKIKYYKDVVEYIHSLKHRCKIAILSNLSPFDKKRIDTQYDLSKFDYVYLSFEIGMRKPESRIYEYVLNDLNITPENILFIDDDENNILMAKKYKWNTCQAYGYLSFGFL